MRIDLPAGPPWRSISDGYRARLPFQDANIPVQVYAGLRHALFEASQGLARLFSHKKTIAIVEGAEPALEALLPGFSEDAYVIKTLKESDLANLDAWLQPILSELVFILFANDDPVTGRLYDRSVLNAKLADKRVFRISVSHAVSHLATTAKVTERPQPFEVRVLSLSPERALILAGERFRVNPVLADKLPWQGDDGASLAVASLLDIGRAKLAIQQFESSLPEGFERYFEEDDENRVFDRAVINHPTIDGSALIDEVCAQMRLQTSAPGFESSLETTSPCRWNQPRVTDWLLARGESEGVVRGLLLIKPELLTGELRTALDTAARKIIEIQLG